MNSWHNERATLVDVYHRGEKHQEQNHSLMFSGHQRDKADTRMYKKWTNNNSIIVLHYCNKVKYN